MQGIDAITVAVLSLIVSVVALGVTIIFGILNRRHTNRAFKATQYPMVGIGITEITVSSFDRRSYLKYQVENHSKDVSLLDVKLIIEIAKPNKKGLGFWSKQWLIYHSYEWDSITPEKHVVGGEASPSIEDFLGKNCPYVLREETPTYYANPPTYYLLRCPLAIRLTVTYQPSVFGIELLTKRDEYTLTQQYESDQRPEKLVWVVHRRKSQNQGAD